MSLAQTFNARGPRIDGMQYDNWSEKIFQQMRAGGVDAVHVTIAYHENFREMVANIEAWNQRFQRYGHLILHGKWASDIALARQTGRTAIFFGFQNPSPIEDDIGLVEVVHSLGARFMQLTYNNQSLLATGCYEQNDPGLTRMGKQVIREMNRVGLVVDMSHSAERSTLEAIELSQRPIAITHANPGFWHAALRNKSDVVLKALGESGGMFGFSLYPHHLKDKSDCTVQSFCEMIARCADLMGVEHLGIGSDLCQDQPNSVVDWMRVGRWTLEVDYGEGSKAQPGFPDQPQWFRDNRDFHNIESGLHAVGFSAADTAGIMGGNWLRFFEESFTPAQQQVQAAAQPSASSCGIAV
jgi:microsomal dipeptidase-like Zn-dependent dipeptidase